MSKYATQHAKARANVRLKGTSITFRVREQQREKDAAGNIRASAPADTLAYAVETTDGAPEELAQLGLLETEAPRLFVVFDVYGENAETGTTAQWAGRTWSVRSVKPFRPDGVVLFAYVILSR